MYKDNWNRRILQADLLKKIALLQPYSGLGKFKLRKV